MAYLSLITQGRPLPKCGTTDPVSRAAVLAKARGKASMADVRRSFVRLWTSEPNMVFVRIMVALSTFLGAPLIAYRDHHGKKKGNWFCRTTCFPYTTTTTCIPT